MSEFWKGREESSGAAGGGALWSHRYMRLILARSISLKSFALPMVEASPCFLGSIVGKPFLLNASES